MDSPLRHTTVIIDRIEPSGDVYVHEDAPRAKLGFIANNTPVAADTHLRRGARLSVEVADIGDVMVIKTARPL